MGFFGDLFSKTPPTKTEILNEIINKTSVEAVASMGSSSSGSSVQNMKFTLKGVTNSTVKDLKFEQISRISISSIQSGQTNVDLQAKLKNDITSAIESKRTDFPELTPESADNKIKTVVSNAVSSKFSSEALSELSLHVDQNMDVEMEDVLGSTVKGMMFKQDAEAIGTQINSMSNQITQALTGETGVSSKSKRETTNFLTDITKTVSDGFNEALGTVAGVFGLDTTTIIAIALVLIISIIAGVFMMKGESGEDIRQMVMRYPPMPMRPPMPQPQMMSPPMAQPQQIYPQIIQPQTYMQPPQYAPPQQTYMQPPPPEISTA